MVQHFNTEDELIDYIIGELTDIFSSGQDSELENWHKREVLKLFEETKLTPEQKVKVFHKFYKSQELEYVSNAEIKWMMVVCKVFEYNIKLTINITQPEPKISDFK
jgi:hypothetical protein